MKGDPSMFKPARRPVMAGDPLLPAVNVEDDVLSPISYFTFNHQSRCGSGRIFFKAIFYLTKKRRFIGSVTFEHANLLEHSAANAVNLESELGLERFVVEVVHQNLTVDLLF